MPRTLLRAVKFGFAACLLLCLMLLVSDTTQQQQAATAQALCPQLDVPTLTHGFATSAQLPNGDHFLLPQAYPLSLLTPDTPTGFRVFPVNETTFGGDEGRIGGFDGTRLFGTGYSQPGGSVTLLSCSDSLWDFSFLLASTGATAGDSVTFFLQKPGDGTITLAVFTYEAGGARVTALNPNLVLFRNNRLASGSGRLQVGDLVAFDNAAGAAGRRTALLTIAFEMRADSPLNDCFQFGLTQARGRGDGANSVVITDVVLKRMEQAGDRSRTQRGLIGGLTGGYPTARVCPFICPACPPRPDPCPQIFNPAVTHGFETTSRLPNGDHFLLRDPYVLTVPFRSPMDGFDVFPVNRNTFGGNEESIGGFAGTNLMGFSYNAVGGSVTALSCTDSLWDFSFLLASAGSTVGDRITFFVQKPDGTGVITLAVFTIESGGARVTQLNPNLSLYLNNRLATGGRVFAGDLIPINIPAGAAGNRSGLLTIAFEMRDNSPLNDCFQFGATIARDGNRGVSSLVFTDFVLKRREQPGDRNLRGMGLIGGLTGGWPTGRVCPEICPECPPLPRIECPPNQTACAAAGANSTNVSYPAPNAFPANATVTCNPASGASFPLGTTTVTCTASIGGRSASCSFTVTVNARPAITCPSNITVSAAGPGNTNTPVTYPAPAVTPAGTAVTCTPASGTSFPVGTTTVTCTATNTCGTATCSFTVTVLPIKCDTFCWHAPVWWQLTMRKLPRGEVLISGVNGNIPVSTANLNAMQQALQGNPTGFGLTPQQAFNQEFVAAQLNLLSAGGGGSVVNANVLWAGLSCYNLNFAPVRLSNGVVLSRDSMVKDLFMQCQLAVIENRFADFGPLAALLDLFNGNDAFGCN